jgi:hypothetical protein
MNILSKYRSIALVLGAIFIIFNVGVPIVIASCPMSDHGLLPVCSGCSDRSVAGDQRLTGLIDTSCCTRVIVADRNTTEFVQSKIAAPHVERIHTISILPSIVEIPDGRNSVILLNNHSPPSPRFEDIPIFNSSLLI